MATRSARPQRDVPIELLPSRVWCLSLAQPNTLNVGLDGDASVQARSEGHIHTNDIVDERRRPERIPAHRETT
jgi:hypothetical protein